MRRNRTISQTLAVALAAGLVASSSAGAEALTPNLVANPGAELGSSSQGAFVTSIPGWTRDPAIGSKLSTVVDYGAPGFPTIAQGAALGGGSHFFAGGPADGRDDDTPAFSGAVLDQDIDIPAAVKDLVKSGGAQATISACLGGYANQDDRVDALLYAHTATDLLGLATVKGPRAADRDNRTGLLPRSVTVKLPPTAMSLAIALGFDRASGAGTYDDGYADNVSVRIGTAGDTPPEPACSPDPSPAPGASIPSPGAPAPSAASSSTATTNTAVPLARVGTRLKLRGAVARLKLRCVARDGACAGSVSLTTRLGKLGSGRFRIAAGEVGTVEVRIPRKMRHRLAGLSRRRLAQLTVTATARIGAATTTFTLGAAR